MSTAPIVWWQSTRTTRVPCVQEPLSEDQQCFWSLQDNKLHSFLQPISLED